MSHRGEPTDRDAFIALWIEETATDHDRQCNNLPRYHRHGEKGQCIDVPPRHERLCDAVELMRRARAADRHAVNLCNREVSDRETRAHERNRAAIEALCSKYGFAVSVGGDPRGYVVKVIFPNGASNTWGGAEEGWGVPTN